MPLSSDLAKATTAVGLDPSRFSRLHDAEFLSLLMSEYSSFGVVDVEEKQKLFRLLKSLNEDAKSKKAGVPAKAVAQVAVRQSELLDLNADDTDNLLAHACGPAMQLSPMGNEAKAKQGPGGAAPVASAANAGAATTEEDPPKIRVVVRKRPLSKKEKEKGDEDIIEVNMGRSYVVVNETKLKVDLTKYVERHQFNFDESLDDTVSNEDVYRNTVGPLVPTLFRNGKASCFAYGQTGSGKTYTMSPLPVRAAADIFKFLTKPEHREISLFVSCFEIYGNKVFDLLNQRKKLNILEDGKKNVVVVGLKEFTVTSVDFLKQLIEESGSRRSTGSTAANADSSRSHSIMQFALRQGGTAEKEGKLMGKISFIDLAGSERGADTFDNNRQTRLEGAEINKSLLALKECIRALDSDARHVPFRGSKLTAVLKDSFVGAEARTVMIANISPNTTSVEHTLNTLRYADRVKELRKDRAERAPGGVTPGEDNYNYNAAIVSSKDKLLKPPVGFQGGSGGGALPEAPEPDDEIMSEHNRMLDTILEEEELLITAHRMHIEETMEMVRSEMNLLTEVDQPGSAIDQYVERLDAILKQKLKGVEELKAKLESFKGHLQQEEQITNTVRIPSRRP